MKKINILIVSFLFLFSCSLEGTLEDLDNFEIGITESTTVPKSGIFQNVLTDVGFSAFNEFDVESQSEFKNQGVTKEQIEWAKLLKFELKVLSPQGQDLSFFESITFYIEAQGLEKQEIASYSEFKEGEDSIILNIRKIDLAPYLTQSSMNITTEVKGEQPKEDTKLEAYILMEIEANL